MRLVKQIQSFLERCEGLRVLVIGDLMIDRYTWGKVSRISPEAPVPIVNIEREESRPGGAANVALNVRELGANVEVCGVVGDDKEAQQLIKISQEASIDTTLVVQEKNRKTTVKNRIIGNHQQIARIDYEDIHAVAEDTHKRILELLIPKLPEYDCIIFEDYDKGLLNEFFIQEIVSAANQHKILVTADPKFENFFSYKDIHLFKPNLKELNAATHQQLSKYDVEQIAQAATRIREQMPHCETLITLGDQGMLLVKEDGSFMHIPAYYRDIADVSGAGDTVISVVSLALAAGLEIEMASGFANLAGGMTCEHVGVVPINKTKLEEEINTLP